MPEHPFELPEGLGEVLQLVVKVDVLLDQRVNRVLQFKAATLQDQQGQRQEEQRRPQSPHGDHSSPQPLSHLHSQQIPLTGARPDPE